MNKKIKLLFFKLSGIELYIVTKELGKLVKIILIKKPMIVPKDKNKII